MEQMTVGDVTFEHDREATREAYARAPGGGADFCECQGCRNFRLVREAGIYPPDFLALLDRLGIDFRKEEEVYHGLVVGPNQTLYSGWFYFVGRLLTNGWKPFGAPVPATIGRPTYEITQIGPGARKAFGDDPTIAIDFTLYTPWRLAETP